MEKLPLLNELIKYHKENNLILSMPGNKCGKAFDRDEIGLMFKRQLGELDITEVDPLDNLHNPTGVIKKAEELLSKLYNSKKAFFMVNGSTGGNLAAIFTAFNEGDEVLVERNCHKSIYNAIILRKLKVVYIDPVLTDIEGLFLPPNKENINTALKESSNPKGIILTYPNYFGIGYNLEEIISDLKNKNLKVIIDEAHGAHFGISSNLPKNLASIADYVIISAHKTIPALTGGSYLLVNDEESNIEFYLRAFMTTSPSYLIMASLDYGRYYLQEYGKEDYNNLIILSEKYINKINSLGKIKIVSNELPKGYFIDKSRYVLVLPKGYSGHKLLDYLRNENIQSEMSFHSGVVLILSPCYGEEQFVKIYNAIKKLDIDEIKNYNKDIKITYRRPIKSLEPYETFNKEGTWESIKESLGKIAKENIIPYPPGIPIVCSGEVINQEAINIVLEYLEAGKSVLGVTNEKILCI